MDDVLPSPPAVPATPGCSVEFKLAKKRRQPDRVTRIIEAWAVDGAPLVIGRQQLVPASEVRTIDDRAVEDFEIVVVDPNQPSDES